VRNVFRIAISCIFLAAIASALTANVFAVALSAAILPSGAHAGILYAYPDVLLVFKFHFSFASF
jgi:hypothetical protein